ncbi:MAG: DbpA RNA binding domain-containing protein [Fuerstiella sp.]|nr:DbpA RNA binding domain-containing protein [Fuerstiella sp.]
MDRYRIAVGWKDGVKPGNIVGAIANEGGIDGDAIGHIRIHSTYSTIDLPKQIPADVLNALQKVRVVGRPLEIRRYSEDTQASPGNAARSGGKPRRRGAFGMKESAHRKDKSRKRPFSRRSKGNGKSFHKAAKNNRRKKSGRSE